MKNKSEYFGNDNNDAKLNKLQFSALCFTALLEMCSHFISHFKYVFYIIIFSYNIITFSCFLK